MQPSNRINNRSVPYNTEAEVYVLGSVLIDNNIIDTLTGKLTTTDFYDPRNQYIYQAMLNIRNKKDMPPINILNVIEELKLLKYNDIENINAYLVEMVDAVPSTASVNAYLTIVEDKAIERKLLATMQEMSDDILTNKYDVSSMLERVEDNMMTIIKQRRTSEFITLADAANQIFEKINSFSSNNGLTGLDTGFENLNKATLGFQKGDLMILAARPSVGKSTYAINLAMQVAVKNNASVAMFSLEMSIEQLLMRIYSYQAQISLSKIRSGNLNKDELLLLSLAKQELEKINIYFDASTSTNISDIRTKCRQLHQAGKLDFVVIDYLQLVTSANSRGNRQEEVSQISRQLKTLAQELNVPILALSQLSRSIEGREDKTPQLSDLRESGSIEQDADMIFFIYRRSDVEDQSDADMLNEEVEKISNVNAKKSQEEIKEVILTIAKNRQGKTGNFDYHFYGHLCKFVEQAEFRKVLSKKRRNGMRRLNGNNNN